MSDGQGDAYGDPVRYLPFGEVRSGDLGELPTDHGFTGHKHEADHLGLIFMQARYYVPYINRFISADTIVPNPANPQSFNRYSYVENRPLNFTDPTGHWLESAWDAFNVGLGIVSLADNLSQGNYGWAAVDTVGLVVDMAALVVPIVPGGVSSVIKAARGVDTAVDAIQTVNRVSNAAQTANQAVNIAQELQTLSRFARYGDEIGSGHQLIQATNWRHAEQQLQNLLGATSQTFRASDIPGMSISTYRRPDMVGLSFIGESKFYSSSTLGVTHTFDQIKDYMRIAEQEGKAFYLFVHVDTAISQQIIELVGDKNIYRVFTGP